MADMDGDGIPDELENMGRIAVMEASRIGEALLRARQAANDARTAEQRQVAREATRRIQAEAAFSRAKLAPVMDERWWERTTPEAAAKKWAEAKGWDGIDESFTPYRERIEREVLERWGLPVEELAREKVEVQVESLKGAQLTAFAKEHAPEWYTNWVDARIADYDHWDDLKAAHQGIADIEGKHSEAMTHLRDTGRLDHPYVEEIRKVSENRGIDVSAGAKEVSDDDRVKYGGKLVRPMTVDDAKQVAAESAPAWYKVHESLEREDMTDLARSSEGARLVEDMSQFRDKGSLDTDSARDEWFRFMRGDEGFREARDGESPLNYLQARREAVNELWERTSGARESIGPTPEDLRDVTEENGRERPAEGPVQGVPVITEPLPVLTEDVVRRDREDKDRIVSAERSAGWESPARRDALDEKLAADPEVSAELRAGIMAADHARAKPVGEASRGRGGEPRKTARTRGRNQEQEQNPNLGR